MIKIESTIKIYFDNCCGEPLTLTREEAVSLYNELGFQLGLTPTAQLPVYPSDTVLRPDINGVY